MKAKEEIKRAALMLAIDYLLADVDHNSDKVLDMFEKTAPTHLSPAQRQSVSNAIESQNSFYELLMHILQLTPDMRDTFLKNLIVNCNLMAWGKQDQARALYSCEIPWAILLDPTNTCNLHCTGCWAAQRNCDHDLSFEEIDSIIAQGKKLGVHFYIYNGGEPLLRRQDLVAIAKKHADCAFLCLTNGTLVDKEFCKEMIAMKNFIPAISIEGDEQTCDARRGKGTHAKALAAMEQLRLYGLPYGVSCCVTSDNIGAICREEFVGSLVGTGALFMWMFSYVPLDQGAPAELALNAEQRQQLDAFTNEMRAIKPLLIIDQQNDGAYAGSSIAGQRRYLRINAAGDIGPRLASIGGAEGGEGCALNIRNCTLLDALKTGTAM